MLLAKEFVIKKLNSALKKSLPKVQKQLREAKRELKKDPDYKYLQKRVRYLENQLKGFNSVDGIPYKPRKNTFEGRTSYGGGWYSAKHSGTVSCGFDIETGRAHSFQWYDLGKIIRGTYVVNNYHYSSETLGHYYMLRNTLKILGIKFIELEAPQGLQDLESGRALQLERIAQATVALEHGSKKSAQWRRRTIRDAEKSLSQLSKFGIKTTQAMRDAAIDTAREARESRLRIEKARRERNFTWAFERAMREQDLKKIVTSIAQNKRRVARGLPSLLPSNIEAA